jgi:hypothetical protein
MNTAYSRLGKHRHLLNNLVMQGSGLLRYTTLTVQRGKRLYERAIEHAHGKDRSSIPQLRAYSLMSGYCSFNRSMKGLPTRVHAARRFSDLAARRIAPSYMMPMLYHY